MRGTWPCRPPSNPSSRTPHRSNSPNARPARVERSTFQQTNVGVGFRNVLVHQYAQVDDRIVLASVDRLVDFDRFVADGSSWMKSLDG